MKNEAVWSYPRARSPQGRSKWLGYGYEETDMERDALGHPSLHLTVWIRHQSLNITSVTIWSLICLSVYTLLT